MKIRLILSIDCEDEQMATKVQDQYLPNLNELLHLDGITAVKAEWLAEAVSGPRPV
jgi:hypothetical protein